VVFVDESAESVAALNLAGGRRTGGSGWNGREQGESSVWALAVVVRRVAAEHVLEVTAAEDQQPVEAFGADAADEALGVRVCLGCADRRVDHLEPFAAEDLVEGGAELAVAVVYEEPHPFEQACEAEVSRLLGDPATGRVGRAARQMDASAFELDKEEDVEATK
jgi:hypothetical protein